MPYYRRRFRAYNSSRGMGTRYASTRRYTGLTRSPARYNLGGRARGVFRRRGSFKRALRSVAEHKYGDTAVRASPQTTSLNAPVNVTGSVFAITPVILGNNDNNRIGDKVTGTSLEVNYSCFPGENTVTEDLPALYNPVVRHILRVTIFIWKDDTTPAVTDINDQATATGIGYYDPVAPLDHDRKVKRKILYDKVHALWAGSFTAGTTSFPSTASNPHVVRRFSIPLTRLKGGLDTINYFAGGVTGVNNIYLLLQSNVTAALSPARGWITEFFFRYNFIDM